VTRITVSSSRSLPQRIDLGIYDYTQGVDHATASDTSFAGRYI
jgi:hypothetical protein